MKFRRIITCLFACLILSISFGSLTAKAAESTEAIVPIEPIEEDTIPVSEADMAINKATEVKATTTSVDKKKSKAKKPSYTSEQLKLMSCIIWCEAGNQSYAGKLAVGCVVMNRVKSGSFPNTIRGVIYQRHQFTPTRNGAMKKALAAYKSGKFKYGARAQCVKAAKAALQGQSYVVAKGKKINMKHMHFFSRSLSHAKVRINAHAFK